jgi:ribosomal protein S18 acetylase RimI-like enzyme
VAPEVALRGATREDEGMLWQVLFYASHANEDPGADVQSIRSDPDLIRYVRSWGRPGDIGVVAEEDSSLVGAAWLRLLVGDEQDSPAFVDSRTPELVIAVLPGGEGHGLGQQMLSALLAQAASVHSSVTLNVREGNPAIRLYERFGFTPIGTMINRSGGRSIKMLVRLD